MKNVMMLCDGCDKGWHLSCLPVPFTSVPNVRRWYCPDCAQPCQGCDRKDLHDNAKKRLLQCSLCAMSWHMHCLPLAVCVEPTVDWRCPCCTSHRAVTRSKGSACKVCLGVVIVKGKYKKLNKTTCSGTGAQCSICMSYIHRECAGMEPLALMRGAAWSCADCAGEAC